MKAVFIDKAHSLSCRIVADPQPAEDEVLVRVAASGICGTDLHIYEGSFLASYPLIPGHEFSGEVVALGSKCQRIKLGDRVAVEPNIPCNNCSYCLIGLHHFCEHMQVPGVNQPGGMAQLVCAKERGVFSIGRLSYLQGAFMEPLSCVLHGVKLLAPAVGNAALVLGAGPIGFLLGRVLRSLGITHIDYLERNPFRVDKVAQECHRVYTDMKDIPEGSYHYVVDATGVSSLASRAVTKLRPTGKLLVFGVPDPNARLDLPAFFVMKNEIQIIGSFTSLKDSVCALATLESGMIRVDDLVGDQVQLDQMGNSLERMARGEAPLKVMVHPQ